ncbi:EcsC family protein [Anoxybacillus vitaminiphilus]|uniref:EcsC family protein n=1 Tax=Paranoxybacillus vitaminiphilus TaxID=581036 RepID=A0A327YPA4_9BACL|nr:EcsC family protein [Anoxybacillus vitaminiphilus]RAK22097.1 EcsC family protein [Anoxybacillus vitaminiphilus]
METKAFLIEELKKIEKWEQEQKDLWFWEKLGRLPFKVLDKLTPSFIHKKVGQLLDEIGSYIQTGGQYLVQEQKILSKFSGNDTTPPLEEIKHFPIETMDRVCDEIVQSRATFAQYQGATTGVGGIFTLAIDIPALLGLALKTLQEIAIAYGYDPKEKRERVFIIKCLQFSSADIVGKKAIFEQLTSFNDEHQQVFSQLQGWREVMMTFRDQYGWKKLLQMIPIVGIIFGAILNKSMIEGISEAGKMLYRKRRILEKLSEMKNSV